MVLPIAQQVLPAVEMQGGYGDSGVWRPGEVDEAAFVYEVSESPADGDGNNNYWVIDYLAPPMQVSFDVTVPKGEEGDLDGAEAPDGAGNYLPAQVYASQTCTRRENDPNWQCQSLLDYGWGRGAPLEGDQDMLTDGVVRGTLDVQELPRAAAKRHRASGKGPGLPLP